LFTFKHKNPRYTFLHCHFLFLPQHSKYNLYLTVNHKCNHNCITQSRPETCRPTNSQERSELYCNFCRCQLGSSPKILKHWQPVIVRPSVSFHAALIVVCLSFWTIKPTVPLLISLEGRNCACLRYHKSSNRTIGFGSHRRCYCNPSKGLQSALRMYVTVTLSYGYCGEVLLHSLPEKGYKFFGLLQSSWNRKD
jgi:hypothetical protein